MRALHLASPSRSSRDDRARHHGVGPDGGAFFDEHVEADAVHEQIASVDMCGSFVTSHPHLAGDVVWGARCGRLLDAAAATRLLEHWQSATPDPAVARD